jgi:uncharacterized protein Yka (UPF0111/DUF47 family)
MLGKEDRFFDLLEASAAEARNSIQALKSFLRNTKGAGPLDQFIQTRRRDKVITNQISDALCSTFVTGLDREDIEELSNALYKIPKTVEKIAERIQLAPELVTGVDFSKPIEMLENAAAHLVAMIQELRKGVRLEQAKALNEKLQHIEGEMDKLLMDQLRWLYSAKLPPVAVVFTKDLFEMLERVSDRCRDAGNVVTHIVLKNS